MSNIAGRLSNGLRNPHTALYYVLFGKERTARFQIRRLVGALAIAPGTKVEDFYHSIASATDFETYIANKLGGASFDGIVGSKHLYVIVRALQPQVVVETGVAAGISSAFILKALSDNSRGALYSIDLPGKYCTPPPDIARFLSPKSLTGQISEERVGFAVPDILKDRWTLALGKSSQVLPGLLKQLGKVDLFLHDSEHTYENMMFEFTTVWDYLVPGKLLLSHDIHWNHSFGDFCKKVNRKGRELFFTGLGAIIK